MLCVAAVLPPAIATQTLQPVTDYSRTAPRIMNAGDDDVTDVSRQRLQQTRDRATRSATDIAKETVDAAWRDVANRLEKAPHWHV